MARKIVKDSYNELAWTDLDKFTKPNGRFEDNNDNQPTFTPKDLPPRITLDHNVVEMLAKAERKIGELRGKGDELQNPHILISAYLKHEAVLSSRIEGTLASLEDLYKYESIGNIGKKELETLRMHEVLNYIEALKEALGKIKNSDRQVDLEIIKDAHKTLMSRVRGQDKSPGKFRTQQNWIADRGTKKIVYTPPAPEQLSKLLVNLEEFFQSDYSPSPLIQCAIIHYQFEAIHPFSDGNGRIGRLLIQLILFKKGILPIPLLYLSAFFEKHRQEYYDGLLQLSQKSRWKEWILFFLRAFESQADDAIQKIQKLVELERRYTKTLYDQNATGNVSNLMESLFLNPYITIPGAKKHLDVSYPSAKRAVDILVKAGILEQLDVSNTSKVYVAREIEQALSVE